MKLCEKWYKFKKNIVSFTRDFTRFSSYITQTSKTKIYFTILSDAK